MYKLLIVLPILCLCLSSSANGVNKRQPQLTNSQSPSIKMKILSSTPEGVPASIGFSKDKKIIVIAKVTSNDDSIDISAGEVYDVTGPQREYEVCNLNAKLSFFGQSIKIDFDQNDVGSEFFRSCSDLAALAGIYNK